MSGRDWRFGAVLERAIGRGGADERVMLIRPDKIGGAVVLRLDGPRRGRIERASPEWWRLVEP